jgi:ABC-type nitrate/sulfonate/bicarbonate transport system permease component
MAPYFVVVIILALIGVALMHGLRMIEKRAMRWRLGNWS